METYFSFLRSLPVLRKGKTCGELKCDLQYFPCNLPDKEEDGTVIPPVESSKYILYIRQ